MELIQQLECMILAGFCQMRHPFLNKTVTSKLVYRLTICVFMELLQSLSASRLHMYSSILILLCSFTSSVVGIMNGEGV